MAWARMSQLWGKKPLMLPCSQHSQKVTYREGQAPPSTPPATAPLLSVLLARRAAGGLSMGYWGYASYHFMI